MVDICPPDKCKPRLVVDVSQYGNKGIPVLHSAVRCVCVCMCMCVWDASMILPIYMHSLQKCAIYANLARLENLSQEKKSSKSSVFRCNTSFREGKRQTLGNGQAFIDNMVLPRISQYPFYWSEVRYLCQAPKKNESKCIFRSRFPSFSQCQPLFPCFCSSSLLSSWPCGKCKWWYKCARYLTNTCWHPADSTG